MGFFNSLPLPESSKVIPAHPCPGLVVVASAHEGHLVSGEEGRASPHRERKRRERAIRLAHLVKISKLFFSKQCFRKRWWNGRWQPSRQSSSQTPRNSLDPNHQERARLNTCPHYLVQIISIYLLFSSNTFTHNRYQVKQVPILSQFSSPCGQFAISLELPLQGGLLQILTRSRSTWISMAFVCLVSVITWY